MKILRQMLRFIRINFVMMRYNIDEIILGSHWFYPLRFIIYFNPFYWTIAKKYSRGQRIRMALEELGPIFVKAGQIFSTRRDLLPEDIALELAQLQDRVAPFSGKVAKRKIEQAWGFPLETVCASFDFTPLASASIAQVHAATLCDGTAVVIKVLRPGIRKMIEDDVGLLRMMAQAAQHYWYQARHFKPREIIEEIAQTLFDELDLMREGANASQLRRNFSHTPMLYIPKIYWTYTRPSILVMEHIYGIPIHNIDALQQAQVNLHQIAQAAIEIFFTQVFRDSFFHADLHPGNIFIDVQQPEQPRFIAVDFGIVGSLNHNDQRYLAENMMAFFKRDYQRVAELHIACGWLPPDTRIDQFEGAIRAVSEPIFEQPISQISFGQLLFRLFQVARRFNMNIQPQLILLQKTLLSIESLSRQLAPDLDMWGVAAPQIEKWLKKQVGFKSFFNRIKEQWPMWSQQLPELPSLIYEVARERKYQQELSRFYLREEYIVQMKKIKTRYFCLGLTAAIVLMSAWYFLI